MVTIDILYCSVVYDVVWYTYSEIDEDFLGEELFLILILWHWGHIESLWYLPKRC